MHKKLLIAASALVLSTSCYATYNQVMNGFYGGASVGSTYISDMDLPSMTTPAAATGNPKLKFKLGVNAGIQVGYRFKDKYRVEAQIFSSYNYPRQLQFKTTTVPNKTWGINGKVNTNAAFFINGFIDLLKDPGVNNSQSAPYFGIGIGRASTTTRVDIENNNVFNSRPINIVQSVMAVQAIAGLNYFIDSYTFIGLDYRLQKYGKIDALNNGFLKHNINITMNFSFA